MKQLLIFSLFLIFVLNLSACKRISTNYAGTEAPKDNPAYNVEPNRN